MTKIKYLLADWHKIYAAIQKSRHVFLLFDYDGTLSPIAPRPCDAKFPGTVKSLIRKLQKNPRFILAVISGRSLKDVRNMVGLKGITYIGNHGLEIEGRKTEFVNSRFRDFIKKIELDLNKEIKHIKGVIVENKGVTLSMHYRLVKAKDKSLVKRSFRKTVNLFVCSKKIRISAGKEVLEVRPNLEWDKGSAVTWLLEKEKRQVLPLYFGDDVTDRDAFRAIKGRGISIFVGNPGKDIKADYFLKSPKDVEKVIEKLIEL